MKRLTVGSRPDCGLVLTAPSVAPVHAVARMDADGHLWLEEQDPDHPVHVRRNGAWLRVRRATLCAGDRVRLGEHDLEIATLTAPFGPGARLRSSGMATPKRPLPGSDVRVEPRPLRDPVTGKIETRKEET